MGPKNVLLLTGLGMASVYNEALKIQSTFHDKGVPCDLVFFNNSSPQRTRLPRYDLAIWWTPFLPMYLSPQKWWLNSQKEQTAISYYVIEGVVRGVEGYRSWLRWQYVIAPSDFVKRNLEEMGVSVKEVVPHQTWRNPPIDHEFGRSWRSRFPSDRKVLLYNGSQIARKGLPKLREAINLLSAKRSDFIMVFHTDRVVQPYHTKVGDLQGPNTVVECEFPHLTREKALAKMYYADIVVHPAITEGFGLPILEALSMGRTLVCVNAYGVNEIADPSNSFMVMNTRPSTLEWKGYLTFKVMDYDPKDLADQIALALDAPREVLDAKRLAGLNTAQKFYHTYERFTEFL